MPASIVTILLAVGFGLTLVHAVNGKVPLWVPVLFLYVVAIAGRVL